MRDLNEYKFKYVQNKLIAVLGYGSQGSAQALNLKDSGLNVIIGLDQNSKSRKIALKDGFEVFTIAEASNKADIILMLLPDEIQGSIFNSDIKPNFKKSGTLVVAHGFSFHFGYIKDFKEYNIGMLAPKAVGKAVRKNFLEKTGIFSLIAKFHEIDENLESILLDLAKGIGSKKALETTFKVECETDIFGEQAVLCGGVVSLFEKAFEVLIEDGYSPEIAYYECVHELKLIADIIYEKGLRTMFSSISNTAKYGGFTRGDYIVDETVKARMKEVLRGIQNGEFAREFMEASFEKKYSFKEKIASKYQNSELEKAGQNVINILKDPS
jgi:ketol-acid reductoisomerase